VWSFNNAVWKYEDNMLAEKLIAQIEKQVFGKTREIRLLLTALFSGGHVLIEDLPGMGKTLLAQTLAKCCQLDFQRIQGSSDLLPADILGVNIYRQDKEGFEFHRGPVFTEVLLFDEMNRTPPKTQSALLQVMAEHEVTVDRQTYHLGDFFFVLGTQNPSISEGTYRLPDSQLDRFSLRLAIGYPEQEQEKRILLGEQEAAIESILGKQELLEIQKQVSKVKIEPRLVDYIIALAKATREDSSLTHGVSVRGTQELCRLSQCWAMLEGRDYVIPSDIRTLAPYVYSHRLQGHRVATREQQEEAVFDILSRVPSPV
jgi:MoxR-like ATPase